MLRRAFPILQLLLVATMPVMAQDQVSASLVSSQSSVQPGSTFTVALRLEHEPHWHTYWINPGTGYPTSIQWDLPAGWSVSDILWPAPIIIRDSHGTITGNGYEGIAYLPLTLTAPADLTPGEKVTLRGHADWLMCADVCIPGDAAIELTLPVVADSPAADPDHATGIRAARDSLTGMTAGITATAIKAGNQVQLTLAGLTNEVIQPWFFASDALIQFDQPQKITSADGMVELVLPISEFHEGPGERLVGVLRQAGSWQADHLAPGLLLDLPLELATADGSILDPSSPVPATSLFGTLVLALVGGLVLNLMPCVFPVLGLKIMGFVNQAGEDRRKVALHGWVFTLGVLASFWGLAGLLAILRAGGDQLGWGFQLQSAGFVFVLTIVMLIFALAMSGVFEFGLSATGVGARLQSREGLAGSFFTGVLATVVATPCSAPFLAPALGAALALPTGESFIVFTAIALGLSAPYLLLSLFPAAIKLLPRPGAWMETCKQVMAFPLYATVGYLVWVLDGQTTEDGSLMVMMGLTVVALSIWLYGRYTAPGAGAGRRRFGQAGGLGLLLAGTALGWPQAPSPTDIAWQAWSPEAVASAQAQGRPVYVDFTARWCATCQTNKKLVFSSAEVKAAFRELDVAALKGDWTNRDSAITAELARWGRSAVPFNLVYRPAETEPVILPEILTPGIVLDALP